MSAPRFVDLSHTIADGQLTYPGLPAPVICDFWSREDTRGHYEEGTTFQIARLELVANTGTYLDTPFHRYADGDDLARIALARCAELDGVVVRAHGRRAVDADAFAGRDLRGRAVLVDTGWSRHWGTDAYFTGHPYLTAAAADHLRDEGAALVGIDSLNIDATHGDARPVHTTLLGAGIPIVEHLTGLDGLPDAGFRFSAVAPRFVGVGSFAVRAYARVG